MASYPTTERLEAIELAILLEELAKTYDGDPLFLVELKEFIEVLDDRDKTIVYLKYLGFSMGEIARELGVTKRRIRQRLKKIRERAMEWIG